MLPPPLRSPFLIYFLVIGAVAVSVEPCELVLLLLVCVFVAVYFLRLLIII